MNYMHQRPLLAAAFFAILPLAACQSVPDAAGTVIQEAGEKPRLDAALRAIRARMTRELRDIDSVKQFAVTKEPTLFTARTAGGAIEKGWLVCVEYNAANAFGGFTGVKEHAYPMRYHAGELVILSPVGWSSFGPGC